MLELRYLYIHIMHIFLIHSRSEGSKCKSRQRLCPDYSYKWSCHSELAFPWVTLPHCQPLQRAGKLDPTLCLLSAFPQFACIKKAIAYFSVSKNVMVYHFISISKISAIHCHKSQDKDIDTRSKDRESEEDEHNAENHVAGLSL